MNYQKIEIYKIAHMLVIDIQDMTLKKLPRFEMYEEGSQIRRSIKSVKSKIVEGYGRRKYRREYIKFLTYAIASNDETMDHLKNLVDTGSLKDVDLSEKWFDKPDNLGRKLYLFRQAIERNYRSTK